MIYTNLKAEESSGDLESRGMHSMVRVEPAPGVFAHVGLGPSGVVVRCGSESRGIPLDEILRLVGLGAEGSIPVQVKSEKPRDGFDSGRIEAALRNASASE